MLIEKNPTNNKILTGLSFTLILTFFFNVVFPTLHSIIEGSNRDCLPCLEESITLDDQFIISFNILNPSRVTHAHHDSFHCLLCNSFGKIRKTFSFVAKKWFSDPFEFLLLLFERGFNYSYLGLLNNLSPRAPPSFFS